MRLYSMLKIQQMFFPLNGQWDRNVPARSINKWTELIGHGPAPAACHADRKASGSGGFCG